MARYENPAGWGALGRRLWGIVRYKWWDLKEWWQNRNSELSEPVVEKRGYCFTTGTAGLLEAVGDEAVGWADREFKYSARAAEIRAQQNNARWKFELERETNRLIAARVQLDSRTPPLFIRAGMVRKDGDHSETSKPGNVADD